MNKLIFITIILLTSNAFAVSPGQAGVCAGALATAFQRNDPEASKYYKILKSDVDFYDISIKKGCPSGINETCFNSLPAEVKIYISQKSKVMQELNSPAPTTFVKSRPIGNDPKTLGVIMYLFCHKI